MSGAWPAHVRAGGDRSATALLRFAETERAAIDEVLVRHGAIRLEGFHVYTPETFREVATTLLGPLATRYLGTSPRDDRARGVFGASELPSFFVVPEHAEMSFLPEPPRWLLFGCRRASPWHGETTLVDGRRVLERLDRHLVGSLPDQAIRIRRRHARPKGWHDPLELKRWPAMFGTPYRRDARDAAHALGFSAAFERDGSLTLEHEQPAVRRHPVTGAHTWLNHLLVFHASTPERVMASAWRNERDLRAAMLRPLAAAYRRLAPRLGHPVASDVTHGDGAPIADAVVAHVADVVEDLSYRHRWREGDLLLIDNRTCLHGRRSYRGERDVLVAWSEATA